LFVLMFITGIALCDIYIKAVNKEIPEIMVLSQVSLAIIYPR